MAPLRLALLVCDTPKDAVLEKYGDYPHMFTKVFGETQAEVTWEYFDVVQKQEYPDIANGHYDGIVISGSSASAYENDDWIVKLVAFVKDLRAHQVKTVGVCFGHQIIARAFGGKCEKNSNGWEFGYADVYLTPLGKTFFGTNKPIIRINQVHQDHVATLPSGFHSLATTAPHTPIHALVSEDNQFLTIQGHPEFNRDTVRILIGLRRDLGVISKDFANEQIAKLDRLDEEKARQGDDARDMEDLWLVEHFVRFFNGDLLLETADRVDGATGNPHGPNTKIGND